MKPDILYVLSNTDYHQVFLFVTGSYGSPSHDTFWTELPNGSRYQITATMKWFIIKLSVKLSKHKGSTYLDN